MHQSARAIAAAALLVGALSGCAVLPGVPGAGAEQTRRQACDQMLPTLLAMNEELTSAFDDLATDPSQASPLLRSVSEDFRDAIDGLENEQVIDVMTTAADSLDAMTDEIDGSLAGEQNEAELRASMTQMQADFTAIDTVCKPA